ncbi:MAG: zf-HC2 domain-containing protein [Bradymonadaceae bacterium]
MNESVQCNEARELFYDLRRDELEGDQQLRLEEHLEGCEACRDHRMRLVGMLDSAAATKPAEEAPFDKGELFESIMGAVNEPEVKLAVAEEKTTFEDGVSDYRRRAPWGFIVAAVALCFLAVMLVPRLIDEPEPGPTTNDEHLLELVLDDEADDLVPALANLEVQELGSEVISIFASPMAKWHLEGEDDLDLRLESGELLVEFLPRENMTLTVSTPDFQARVLGTVFYLSTERQRLGVVSGAVEVKARGARDDMNIRVLKKGEEIGTELIIDGIPGEDMQAARGYVDIDGHEEKVSSLRAAAVVDKPVASRADAPPRPARNNARRDRLWRDASEAMGGRRYGEAARHYEALLNEIPSSDPASMSIRLDLARIYRQHLDRPERAVGHLRTFVMNRPDDVAAPSAVQELCRILAVTNERDPLCIGR